MGLHTPRHCRTCRRAHSAATPTPKPHRGYCNSAATPYLQHQQAALARGHPAAAASPALLQHRLLLPLQLAAPALYIPAGRSGKAGTL